MILARDTEQVSIFAKYLLWLGLGRASASAAAHSPHRIDPYLPVQSDSLASDGRIAHKIANGLRHADALKPVGGSAGRSPM